MRSHNYSRQNAQIIDEHIKKEFARGLHEFCPKFALSLPEFLHQQNGGGGGGGVHSAPLPLPAPPSPTPMTRNATTKWVPELMGVLFVA